MLDDKAQAALEFIMAYGWAILVVLIGVAALGYSGVLSPDKFLPSKCVLPSGIACLDYKVESYRVILVLQNALGETITIDNVTVSANEQQCSDNQRISLYNNEKAIITITGCSNGAEGQKFNGFVTVLYTVEDKLAHGVLGTIRAKVVEGSPISFSSVCENAQSSGFCSGLDIVFGEGYRAACCSEHSLCCT